MEEPKANLKPCPCCGGKAVIYHRRDELLDDVLHCHAQCISCCIRTSSRMYDNDKSLGSTRSAVREVEAVWNRRDG